MPQLYEQKSQLSNNLILMMHKMSPNLPYKIINYSQEKSLSSTSRSVIRALCINVKEFKRVSSMYGAIRKHKPVLFGHKTTSHTISLHYLSLKDKDKNLYLLKGRCPNLLCHNTTSFNCIKKRNIVSNSRL